MVQVDSEAVFQKSVQTELYDLAQDYNGDLIKAWGTFQVRAECKS